MHLCQTVSRLTSAAPAFFFEDKRPNTRWGLPDASPLKQPGNTQGAPLTSASNLSSIQQRVKVRASIRKSSLAVLAQFALDLCEGRESCLPVLCLKFTYFRWATVRAFCLFFSFANANNCLSRARMRTSSGWLGHVCVLWSMFPQTQQCCNVLRPDEPWPRLGARPRHRLGSPTSGSASSTVSASSPSASLLRLHHL